MSVKRVLVAAADRWPACCFWPARVVGLAQQQRILFCNIDGTLIPCEFARSRHLRNQYDCNERDHCG